MDTIQSYYTLSNKNNGAELMLLFNITLSFLINKLSFISNKNLWASWAKIVRSLNEGSWSRIKLLADGYTFDNAEINELMQKCQL